ncbi:MAG TPA: DUF2203 domain-containing protein [Verrucomicrobiae bacterium]|nr:DUF2203 domain-containing protein [Verrucomicrobiae bacterium]
MPYRFKKHFTREEACALLPQIRLWFTRILQLRGELEKCERRLEGVRSLGADLGGDTVNQWVHMMAEINSVFLEFHRREIQIKDLDRGLVDFPAIVAGREVFLCWEKDEDAVEFWHDIDSGYAGRERL